MAESDARNEQHMRHFQTRAAQPRSRVQGAARPPSQLQIPAPSNVTINIQVDHSGSTADQIDNVKYRYVGLSPQYSRTEAMCSRRTAQNCAMLESGCWY